MTALTDATFYAPLKTTLVPTNGSGNPTATRTSTKTVEDNEGKVKTLKSGAVGLAGARVVHNGLVYTEAFANASWVKYGAGTGVAVVATDAYALDPYSLTMTASRLQFDQGAGTSVNDYSGIEQSLVGDFPGTVTNIVKHLWLKTNDGSTKLISHGAAVLTVTGTWQHFQYTTGSLTNFQLIIRGTYGTSTSADILVWHPQAENTSGQAIQTAGEYVSVGVLANPYHGLGTDGAKCFDTDSSGVAIPDATMLGAQLDAASKTNSMLYCRDLTNLVWIGSVTGSELITNPAFDTDITNWTDASEAPGAIAWNASGYLDLTNPAGLTTTEGRAWQGISGLTIGLWYTVTVTKPAATGASLVVQVGTGGVDAAHYGQITVSSTELLDSLSFKATATTASVTLRNFNSAGTVSVTSVSLKLGAVDRLLTQTGVDGLANACSLLTFNATDATILQTITAASTPACTGFKVKRSVGTDPVYITRDGTNYTDISGLINSSTFTLVGIENTSVTNPIVGFKSSTGNEIIVDSGRNHSGTELCEDIFTTTAAITRAAESLTYQTSGNFSDTAGTILATVKRDNWANGNGSAVGKASFGLLTSASNSGVQAADGTNTVSGAAGTPTGQRKIGARWSGSSLQAFYQNNFGTAGSYDGSFNLATIAVMPGTQGYIRDLAIFNSSLADTAMPWYVAPVSDATTYGRALGLAGEYFAHHNRVAQERYKYKTEQEKKDIESRKRKLRKIIKAEIKKDNFVLSGVEQVVINKGYNVDSDMYFMLYDILNSVEYKNVRGKINAALIEMEKRTRIKLLQEEENEIMQIIALIH